MNSKETELSATSMAALCYVESVWELPRPKLLISVTGGAQDFNMNRSKEDVLYKLMEAARKTNAWIITGGTDAGIMKYVGMCLVQVTVRKFHTLMYITSILALKCD